MTLEEQTIYCADIMAAAKRLGILCKNTSSGDVHSFSFLDGRKIITGPSASTPKNALQAACDKLTDHLNVPKNDSRASRYGI